MVSTLLAKWSHRRSQNVIWIDSGNDLSFDSSKSFSESMAVYNYLDSWEYIWLQWNLVQNLNISIISPTEMTYGINHKIYFNAMLSNSRHIFLRINALPWMSSPRFDLCPKHIKETLWQDRQNIEMPIFNISVIIRSKWHHKFSWCQDGDALARILINLKPSQHAIIYQNCLKPTLSLQYWQYVWSSCGRLMHIYRKNTMKNLNSLSQLHNANTNGIEQRHFKS